MKLMIKVLILLILIISVIIHHAAVHGGVLFDIQNLASHEAIVTCLSGILIGLIIWGRK